VQAKHGNPSPSYLKRSVNRQKANVLASVDHAIEDGATGSAKKKAYASRSQSPGKLPKSGSSGNLKGDARERATTKSTRTPRRSKSIDNKGYRVKGVRKVKAKSMDPSAAGNASAALKPDDNPVRSIRSIVKDSPKRTDSPLTPSTPAWKARLQNRSKSPSASKSTSGRTPKSTKRTSKKSEPNPFSLQPPFASEEAKAQKKEKKQKKDKKKKDKKKKKSKDKEVVEGSEGLFNNDDVKRRNAQNPVKKVEEDLAGARIADLRRQVEEAKTRLQNIGRDTKQELSDMEKDYNSTKDAIRIRIMKCIHAQGKKNDEKFQAYKAVVDAKQKEIDDLRAANQRIRSTIQKLPKQTADMLFSNQALEEANEEIAGHIEGLGKFDKKLQADQEKLIHSSNKCKNEYLPRYRQQLWEGKQHLDSEIKSKNLYRDCIIKITKKLEKSKQVSLMEEVASMVVEVEGEVNPKFDPEFLSSTGDDYDTSSHNTSNDSDDSSLSSYMSSSSSDSD